MQYFSGTVDEKIFYPVGSVNFDPLTAYADTDWGGCHETRRSTTGVVLKVNSAPIYWTSKRQSMVALSSTEAEYIAVSTCGRQVVCFRNIFSEVLENKPINSDLGMASTKIFTDSTSALSLLNKQNISERNKNIEIKAHHIKELVETRVVALEYTKSSMQLVDICTEPIARDVLESYFNI